MTGVEELGWYAFVVFAQVIGPAVWFLFARERYEWAAATAPMQSAAPSAPNHEQVTR